MCILSISAAGSVCCWGLPGGHRFYLFNRVASAYIFFFPGLPFSIFQILLLIFVCVCTTHMQKNHLTQCDHSVLVCTSSTLRANRWNGEKVTQPKSDVKEKKEKKNHQRPVQVVVGAVRLELSVGARPSTCAGVYLRADSLCSRLLLFFLLAPSKDFFVTFLFVYLCEFVRRSIIRHRGNRVVIPASITSNPHWKKGKRVTSTTHLMLIVSALVAE